MEIWSKETPLQITGRLGSSRKLTEDIDRFSIASNGDLQENSIFSHATGKIKSDQQSVVSTRQTSPKLSSADAQNLQNRFNRSKFVTSIDLDNEVQRKKAKHDGSLEITAWGDPTEVKGKRVLPSKVNVKGS